MDLPWLVEFPMIEGPVPVGVFSNMEYRVSEKIEVCPVANSNVSLEVMFAVAGEVTFEANPEERYRATLSLVDGLRGFRRIGVENRCLSARYSSLFNS
jgi:hypothetical protein